MEIKKGGKYRTIVMIWFAFVISIFLDGYVIYIAKGPFPLNLDYYFSLFTSNNPLPSIIKLYSVLAAFSFILFFATKNKNIKLFNNLPEINKHLLIYAFAKSIELYGLKAALEAKIQGYYIPFMIIALICLIFSFPQRENFEENKVNQPSPFE